MKKINKGSKGNKTAFHFVKTKLGFVGAAIVLVVFSVSLCTLLSSCASPTTVSQPPSPSYQELLSSPTPPPSPTAPLPSPTSTSAALQAGQTVGWKTYTDSITGLSFKYPEDWRIAETTPGKNAKLINTSSQYYRAIEFIISDNPARLLPDNFTIQKLKDAYGEKLVSTFHVEPFKGTNFDGIKVTGFPEGIHTVVAIAYGETIIRISLIEGGEIGGAPASSFPTALEDEQVFYQILDTVEISPP